MAILLLLILLAYAIGYYKGSNEQEMKALAAQISADYSILSNIDGGKVNLARAGLIAKTGGEIDVYKKLSTNFFIESPERHDEKLKERLEKIGSYIKAADIKMRQP